MKNSLFFVLFARGTFLDAQFLFHAPAQLEADGAFGGNFHALERLGVLRGAGGTLLGFKHAKVAKLQPVAVPQ